MQRESLNFDETKEASREKRGGRGVKNATASVERPNESDLLATQNYVRYLVLFPGENN